MDTWRGGAPGFSFILFHFLMILYVNIRKEREEREGALGAPNRGGGCRLEVDRCVLELSRFRDNSRERVLEGHTCPPPLWAFGLGGFLSRARSFMINRLYFSSLMSG